MAAVHLPPWPLRLDFTLDISSRLATRLVDIFAPAAISATVWPLLRHWRTQIASTMSENFGFISVGGFWIAEFVKIVRGSTTLVPTLAKVFDFKLHNSSVYNFFRKCPLVPGSNFTNLVRDVAREFGAGSNPPVKSPAIKRADINRFNRFSQAGNQLRWDFWLLGLSVFPLDVCFCFHIVDKTISHGMNLSRTKLC